MQYRVGSPPLYPLTPDMKIGHEKLVADFLIQFLDHCYGLITVPSFLLVVPQL